MTNSRRVAVNSQKTVQKNAKPTETDALDLNEVVAKAAAENQITEKSSVNTAAAAETKPVAEVEQSVDAIAKAAENSVFNELRDEVSEEKSEKAASNGLENATHMYMSHFPNLTVYLETQEGKSLPIKFKNGNFMTDDPFIAEQMQKLQAFGSLFTKVDDHTTYALREQAEKRRAALRQGHSKGSTSADENHQRFQQQDAALAKVVGSLF